MNARLSGVLLFALATGLPMAACLAAEASLSVEGSAFVLKTPDGRVLRGTELAGATVFVALLGEEIAPVKLVSIAPDPERPDIPRHDFQSPDGQGGGKPACEPNA